MGWGITDNEENLRFVNYNNRLDLEDGRIAFWELEDWEIYGPDAGGYTSTGPFGAWRDDIYQWFQNHLMDGRDIVRWSQGSSHSGPNFDAFQALTPSLCQNICCFMNGPKISMINGVVGFGAARQYNGSTNPQLGIGDVMPGDIVVNGTRWHDDQSMTFRYRAFDHDGGGFADFAENYDFLSVAVAESDALAGVTADFSHVNGLSVEALALLQSAFNAIKLQIESILSNLSLLNPASYFAVSYTDEGGTVRQGRIRVSELIMWFSRIDFEFYPANTNFDNHGAGATDVRRGSLFQSADVTLKVDEAAFRRWASTLGESIWYLIHEIVHASSFGNTLLNRYDNGVRLERLINAYTQEIAHIVAPNAEAAVRAYVATTRPATTTTSAFDYTPAPDADTTFVTPTT
ncbi:MAG: hypothetical protein ABL882_06710 [Sphingopyxis sp.]